MWTDNNEENKCFRKGEFIMLRMMKDKRGSTLIEVIISVMIVGIVFIPLLMGLNTAMRVNAKNEKELYAENVAENVIELCKTYGENGLEEIYTKGDTEIQKIFSNAEIKKVPGGYKIKNIEAGTGKTFTAEISFKTVNGPQNDFSGIPVIGNISDADIESFPVENLDSVVDWFYQQSEIGKEYGGAENVASKQELIENIDKWLCRENIVLVNKKTETSGTTTSEVIQISRQVKYFVSTVTPNPQIGNGKTCFANNSMYTMNPKLEELDVVNIPGEAGTVQQNNGPRYDEIPSSIVVRYRAFTVNGENKKLNSDQLTIKLENGAAGNFDVFAFCENGTSLYNKGFTLNMKYSGPTGMTVSAYSNLLDHTYPEGFSELKTTLESTTDTDEMGKYTNFNKLIRTVDLTITDITGNTVLTKTSTIIDNTTDKINYNLPAATTTTGSEETTGGDATGGDTTEG